VEEGAPGFMSAIMWDTDLASGTNSLMITIAASTASGVMSMRTSFLTDTWCEALVWAPVMLSVGLGNSVRVAKTMTNHDHDHDHEMAG